ncbi:MAG: hypothetical protein SF182_04580 [Deltaproteobacteria bacterium]|nr:hypothetical protein [Deltaproteobacteria bacterium]
MTQLRATVLAGLALLVGACGDGSSGGARAETPARLVDGSHDALATADFLRLIFVPSSVQVTTLGGPRAVRVFVAASSYFTPALPLDEVAAYLGVPDNPALDLVALRCTPSPDSAVDARFASWPHVFDIVRADLAGQYTCPPPSGAAPENSVYCVAAGYSDPPLHVVARGLGSALLTGAGLLEEAATAEVMRVRYGIYPSFSGLGLTVAGSGDGRAFSAADSLAAAVSPEYLLRNASLADAGCRCIRVAPYDGRADDPLDPRFIEQRGGQGSCRSVSRLRRAS